MHLLCAVVKLSLRSWLTDKPTSEQRPRTFYTSIGSHDLWYNLHLVLSLRLFIYININIANIAQTTTPIPHGGGGGRGGLQMIYAVVSWACHDNDYTSCWTASILHILQYIKQYININHTNVSAATAAPKLLFLLLTQSSLTPGNRKLSLKYIYLSTMNEWTSLIRIYLRVCVPGSASQNLRRLDFPKIRKKFLEYFGLWWLVGLVLDIGVWPYHSFDPQPP